MTPTESLAEKILPILIYHQVPIEAGVAILAICKNVDDGGRLHHLQEAHRAVQAAINRLPIDFGGGPWSATCTIPEEDKVPEKPQYRMLELGEVINKEDEVLLVGGGGYWRLVDTEFLGSLVGKTLVGFIRRPITTP